MIFEIEYGKWITRQLNARVRKLNKDFVCKRYDEVAQKPAFSDPNEVAVIIYGGNAARSSVRGLDYNTLPLSVLVICWEEYSVLVRNAVDAMQEQFNAVQVGLGEINLKSVFTTPFIIDEVDYPTETETKKACYISFSATVFYGKTAIVEPPDATLIVDGESYPIDHIASYSFVVQPSYDAALPQGDECARQSKISVANTYSFSVFKTQVDPLQEVFRRDILKKDGGLKGKQLKLILDGEEIEIRTYDLAESYTGGNAAAYTLNLC